MEVLLVTNDPQYKFSMRQALTHEGCDVTLAKSGKEGLQILKTNKIDLVISELDLPFMDGIAFCRMAREFSKSRDVPFVIIYSGQVDTKKLSAEAAERCTFISKGSSGNKVQEILQGHISNFEEPSPDSSSSPDQREQTTAKQEIETPPEEKKEIHRKARILLVDDEESFRMLLCDALTDEGYEDITMAPDGGEAIELLKREKFDLVLLDIIMPFVSGFGVLHYIHDNAPSTKVIMLTAYAEMKLAVEAKALGAADFIAKPIMRKDFFRTVEHVLSQ